MTRCRVALQLSLGKHVTRWSVAPSNVQTFLKSRRTHNVVENPQGLQIGVCLNVDHVFALDQFLVVSRIPNPSIEPMGFECNFTCA